MRPVPLSILLLLVALCLFAAPLTAQTVDVVDGGSTDWIFLPEGGSTTPTGYFATGPATPPAGDGSAYLGIDDNGDGIAIISRELIGTPLTALKEAVPPRGAPGELSYWTYTSATTGQAPVLQFSIDYDTTDSCGGAPTGGCGWQGRLVFEPYQSDGAPDAAPVVANTWQQWQTLATASGWWSTGNPVVGNAAATKHCTQSSPCSFQEVVDFYPNAAIYPDYPENSAAQLGQLLIKSGSGWAAVDTYTDALRVTTSSGARGAGIDVLYDFEPTMTQTNTSMLSENGWYSDDTRADGTAAVAEGAGTNLVSPTLTDDPEASSGAATPDHDDDIRNQIDFPMFGLPVAAPAESFQGSVHLSIADGVGAGKSQISHRNDPDQGGDATGFGFGHEILNPFTGFLVDYFWMGDGTASVTASFKLGFKTNDPNNVSASSRTGENAWDKLLIYEPGNGNGGTSDGTWQRETTNFTTGKWWLVDRSQGGGITIGNPMELSQMSGSGTAIGGRTVADIWALLVDADNGEEAILTTIQIGIGSGNAGGSVYVNQVETNFYRKGEVTTFGFGADTTTVICVPGAFDAACDVTESTIQAALDTPGLGAEDIIMVDSGVYAENPVVVATPVTLMGAQAGVNACGRMGSETTLTGTMQIMADDVTVDGFAFSFAGTSLTADDSDRLTVQNTAFVNGGTGMSVADSTDATIASSRFTGDPSRGVTSAHVLLGGPAVNGVQITDNCFENSNLTAVLFDVASTFETTRRPAVSGNTFASVAAGVDASDEVAADLDIVDNLFDSLSGTAIAGILQNALIDGNTVKNSGDGVYLFETGFARSSFGEPIDNVLVDNCFFENIGTGLSFASSNGVSVASNSASSNDFVGNGVGADNSGNGTVQVTNNYWGAGDGPSGEGPGSGDSVSTGFDFTPFSAVPQTLGTVCNPTVDLWVTKVDDLDDADVSNGVTVTYTIEVGNGGLFGATGAQVQDTPPAGLDACSWTCSASGLAACDDASGNGPIDEIVDIPAGDTVTYELACTFNGGDSVITNVATVTAAEVDTNLDNNSASAQTAMAIFIDGFESGDTNAWN